MQNKFDICAAGETLIDFTPADGDGLFKRNPGGAPANVLAMAQKLGAKTAFIGKVGRDFFGDFLARTMQDAGICTDGLVRGEEPTTLAFVQFDGAERSFSFVRKMSADVMLNKDEIDGSIIQGSRIFHFGSVSLTDEPSAGATLYAARIARDAGIKISYDPNYRPLLWRSREDAIAGMRRGAEYADIIKVSDEELALISGETDTDKGIDVLLRGAALVAVTMGGDGSVLASRAARVRMPAYEVDAVDTTGAGDAYFGALLYKIKDMPTEQIARLNEDELKESASFAAAAGALTVTKYGAIPAMPSAEEIAKLIG